MGRFNTFSWKGPCVIPSLLSLSVQSMLALFFLNLIPRVHKPPNGVETLPAISGFRSYTVRLHLPRAVRELHAHARPIMPYDWWDAPTKLGSLTDT